MADRPTDEQLGAALFVLAGHAGDLSLCPYYRGTGTCMQEDVCSYAMGQPEPMCQTFIPGAGWPLDRHPEVREWMLGIAFTPNPNDEETF